MDLATNPLVTDLYQLNMMEAYLDHGETKPAVFEFFVRRLPERARLPRRRRSRSRRWTSSKTSASRRSDLDWLASTGRFTPAPARLSRGVPLHRRRPCHAGGHGLLRQRADSARHRAAAGGAVRRDAADEPPPLPDADRLQGGAHGACRRRASCWSISASAAPTAPRPGCSPPAPATSPDSPAPPRSRPGGCSASRSSAPWRIPSSRRTTTRPPPSSTSPRRVPRGLTLLIDTYDTEAAARKVVALAPRLAGGGNHDPERAPRQRRSGRPSPAACARILDAGGLAASDHLRQRRARRVRARRAGRRRRADRRLRRRHQPHHLVRRAGAGLRLQAPGVCRACRGKKLSPGKSTWPGRKQVWRRHGADGRIAGDIDFHRRRPASPARRCSKPVMTARAAARAGARDCRDPRAGGRRELPICPKRSAIWSPARPTRCRLRRRCLRSPPRPTGGSRLREEERRERQDVPGGQRRPPGRRHPERFLSRRGACGPARRRDRAARQRAGRRFRHVVLTQDWHPAGPLLLRLHPSRPQAVRRRSSCPTGRRSCGRTIASRARPGPQFRRDLDIPHAAAHHPQGLRREHQLLFGALRERPARRPTGLAGYLRERGLDARRSSPASPIDFCVRYSAEDACKRRASAWSWSRTPAAASTWTVPSPTPVALWRRSGYRPSRLATSRPRIAGVIGHLERPFR